MKQATRLGDGIRIERQKQQLTLAQLAERSGLSTSALSQVERGLVEPSIGSLRRIATALGLPVFQFLIDPQQPSPVIRKASRRTITFQDRVSRYELLTSNTRGAFEVLSLELAPGSASGDAPIGHDSEELLLVLQGTVEIEVAGERYTLGAGDSVQLQRNVPHRAVNRSKKSAEVLMVISPPTF